MNKLAKFTLVALAAGMPGVASAQVEYSIEKDPSFPSVVYVEFDTSTMPVIYTAPEGGGAMPVIRGGSVGGDISGGAPAQPVDNGSRSEDRNNSSGDADMSVNERAQQRVEELVNSSPDEIEDLIIDREIEDRLLEDTDLGN